MSKRKALIHPARLEQVSTCKIKQNPNAIKLQTEQKIVSLIHIIEEIGLFPAIITDEQYSILDGHAVYLAAKAIGYPRIPVIIMEGLSEREKEIYMYAACTLAQMAVWNCENIRNPWRVYHV